MKLHSSITRYITLVFVLSIAQIGNTQNVFNKVFDENNTANHTANILEYSSQYYFTQKSFINGNAVIQGLIMDTNGQMVLKKPLVINSNFNLYYGYAGALQYLSNNEFCQLYNVGLDSILKLVFFDENLNVIRNTQYIFNNYVNAGILKQINDSSLLVLGRVKVANDYNLVLINTDLQGNERWRTIFGETGKDDNGFAIEYFNDKILVGGQTYYTGQIAHPHIYEFNISGQLVFDTTYTQFDNGGEIMYSNLHGLYQFCSRNNYPTSVYPILLKINPDYSIQWAKEFFKDEQFVAPGNVTMSTNGAITVAGTFKVNGINSGLFFQTNQNGDSLGSKLLDFIPGERAQFHDIRPTSDCGYILAGETKAPTQDSWIVKVNEWGCDNIPCIVSVAEAPKNDNGNLTCYPNPSNGFGTIKGTFKNAGSNNKIKVFNSLGQLVFSKIITNIEFEMVVSLPISGLYLVNLYEGDKLINSKKWVVR